MTWLKVFLIYYITYQGINFVRYCYNTYGRQTAGQRRERRMDYEKPEGEDHVKGLFELLSENEQREGAQTETVPLNERVGEGAGEEGFEEIIKTESKKES